MYSLGHRYIASAEEYDEDEEGDFSGEDESGVEEESPRSSQSDDSSMDQTKFKKYK